MAKRFITNLQKRHAKERRFKAYGIFSIAFALGFLVILFSMILTKGSTAFLRSEIALEIDLTKENTAEEVNYRQAIKQALKTQFPEAKSISETNFLYQLVSKVAALELQKNLEKNPQLLGTKPVLWFSASSKSSGLFTNPPPVPPNV